jgi:hypothetical protein
MTLQDAASGSLAAEAAHALVTRLVAELHGTTDRGSRSASAAAR